MHKLTWHESWMKAVMAFGICKRGWDKNLNYYTESEAEYKFRRSVWLQEFLSSKQYDAHCKRMGVVNRYR